MNRVSCQGVQQYVSSYCAPFLLGLVLCCNECCRIASHWLMQHASQLPHQSKPQTLPRGRERQQEHAFSYVRQLAQHCMPARSHIPSTDAFAACCAWAKMHRCPQTGYTLLYSQKYARLQEQTSHPHRVTMRGEREKHKERERGEAREKRAKQSRKSSEQ